MTKAEREIKQRPFLHYYMGLVVRWKQNLRYALARCIARANGASLGEGVVMPISFARKLNGNVTLGNHVSIQTDSIDTRSPLHIGNNVIIGSDVEIITTSHNIDSPEWEAEHYGLTIGDYVWLAPKALVLPSCRAIGRGAVIGAGSVVVKNVEQMSVVSGNPAKELRKRATVHSDLMVESLLGGDYHLYREARKK